MDIQKFIEIMTLAERMKCNTRHSWTSTGRHESVAEHSWRLCLMAYFIRDEFSEADMDKVLKMCLLHDIGEAFTGDIPSFLKTESDEAAENIQVDNFVKNLPAYFREELIPLFHEMNALETPEARIYKALDKMEAILQHNEADTSTWLPLEYELNLTYGVPEAEFSPYLKALRDALKTMTIAKAPESYSAKIE
ncbi:MAG: HD family hydrolase [Oscillospiraceae bacterium]